MNDSPPRDGRGMVDDVRDCLTCATLAVTRANGRRQDKERRRPDCGSARHAAAQESLQWGRASLLMDQSTASTYGAPSSCGVCTVTSKPDPSAASTYGGTQSSMPNWKLNARSISRIRMGPEGGFAPAPCQVRFMRSSLNRWWIPGNSRRGPSGGEGRPTKLLHGPSLPFLGAQTRSRPPVRTT